LKHLKFLLLPFAFLYRLVTDFRNHLYNIGSRKSAVFDLPLINVGNLTVGGTGKTPHIEYLIRLLKNTYKLATLSRGYGRKSKGFLLADSNSTARTIGDEPMQFFEKFGNEITVAVCEERAVGIPWILAERVDTQVVLLDDAFQHRAVTPSLNLLLTDYNRLFYQDYLLPAGRLRESANGAKRAHAVLVSKCPDNLTPATRAVIIDEIEKYISPQTPVFFTGIEYGEPVFVSAIKPEEKATKVLLVSGIATPEVLRQYASENFDLRGHLIFKDHHTYSEKDLKDIIETFEGCKADFVLTTEKDMTKLRPTNLSQKLPLAFLPIEIYFLTEEETFQQLIARHLEGWFK
jgi:tetraacyldisaccharide 4'-kinase